MMNPHAELNDLADRLRDVTARLEQQEARLARLDASDRRGSGFPLALVALGAAGYFAWRHFSARFSQTAPAETIESVSNVRPAPLNPMADLSEDLIEAGQTVQKHVSNARDHAEPLSSTVARTARLRDDVRREPPNKR